MLEENEVQNIISYGKAMFNKTLVGRVYKYLKKHRTGTTSKLLYYVMKKPLYKSSGLPYNFESKTACRKALMGIIGTRIFSVTKDNWALMKLRAKDYKQVKIRKYYNKSLRQKNRLPLSSKPPKLFKKIKFMQKTVIELKNKKETENLFNEPFKALDGTEGIFEAAEKVGKPRLLGMIEGFLITTKYCNSYIVNKIMNKNYQNSTYNIQDKLISIYERLKRFEKYLERSEGRSSKPEDHSSI